MTKKKERGLDVYNMDGSEDMQINYAGKKINPAIRWAIKLHLCQQHKYSPAKSSEALWYWSQWNTVFT